MSVVFALFGINIGNNSNTQHSLGSVSHKCLFTTQAYVLVTVLKATCYYHPSYRKVMMIVVVALYLYLELDLDL